MNDLITRYFVWLRATVSNDPLSRRDSYERLFWYLYNKKFYAVMPADVDRIKDGVYLRKMFYEERAEELNQLLGDCSVLEMMIALARRCEMDTMYNSTLGNRTGQWFWEMIASLKLGQMTDVEYDSDYVDMRINNFLSRHYKINGEGGLFTVANVTDDMRTISISKQLNLYLNEVLMDEGLLPCT